MLLVGKIFMEAVESNLFQTAIHLLTLSAALALTYDLCSILSSEDSVIHPASLIRILPCKIACD
jgi:hypothetical protein